MIAYGNQANLNTRAELHFARGGGEAGRAQSCTVGAVLAPIKYRYCQYWQYSDNIVILLSIPKFYITPKGYLLSI